MVTADEVARIAIFADLGLEERERIARAAADISLSTDEYAAEPKAERALFGLLDGRIHAVRIDDGIPTVVGERHPGDVFGEVPITLGTVFPVGFRASGPSRVMRIEASDYHALADTAPTVGMEVARLAAFRMSGALGLQGLAADPPPNRAIVVGHRWDPHYGEIQRFLERNEIRFKPVTLGTDGADAVGGSEHEGPVLQVVGGETVVRPSLRRVAELLQLDTEPSCAEYD